MTTQFIKHATLQMRAKKAFRITPYGCVRLIFLLLLLSSQQIYVIAHNL
jgi:hypothetical protein